MLSRMSAAAWLSLALLCAAPGAEAARSLTYPAPEFPSGNQWVNARPFTLAQLRDRRAVLVAFLNAANVNSIRAIPVLNAWFDLYGLSGLMVIGVHTADFDFQRDAKAVRESLRRLGARFPIVIDYDRRIWKAYANDGWPAFYLLDHEGKVVFDRLGEGGYRELETEIRNAAGNVPGYPAPAVAPFADDPPSRNCGAATPEVTLGERRRALIDLDSRGGNDDLRRHAADLEASDTADDKLLAEARNGEVSHRGKWLVEQDALRLGQKNADRFAFLRVVFRGLQAFAVLGPAPREPARVFVKQDDFWLHAGNAGKDVLFDDDGRSYVTVGEPRLYELIRNPNDSLHEVLLMPTTMGASVYSLSFADRCLPVALP